MNEFVDERGCCYFHTREKVVGVCALCLNERLLVVASKQQIAAANHYMSFAPKRVLPKIFALTNLLNPNSHIKRHKSSQLYNDDDDDDDDDHHTTASSPPSPEDSFISIKFEENGIGSWDKGKISKITHDDQQQCEMSNLDKSKKMKSVIEHAKPRTSLRWRRPIGHLFQLIKRKRSSKQGNVCHVGTKLEKEKVKYGWIRILTKKRSKE